LTQPTERRPFAWWRSSRRAVVAVAVIVVIAAAVFFFWPGDALSPKHEPETKPDQVAAMENDLRAKGSAEDALARYGATLQQMAHDITALVPGLKWHWNRSNTSVTCPGPLADTRGVQILPRQIVFEGPISDEVWPQALARVRMRAAALGVREVSVHADMPGHHDVAISGDNDAEIRFGTRVAAVLSARSDCYLKAADL
jgi:hypothetical protein